MLYLIGPDGLVNQGLINFQKVVLMTTVRIVLIHAGVGKFAYPRLQEICIPSFTRYADYISFSHK